MAWLGLSSLEAISSVIRISPSLHYLMALSLSIGLNVLGQSTTQSTTVSPNQSATQSWYQAPQCTNGLTNPALQNGSYSDHYGANWAVQCGQDSTGFFYDGYEGTNGQGPYACFKGCDSRPRCTAFMYQGSVSSEYVANCHCVLTKSPSQAPTLLKAVENASVSLTANVKVKR